MKKGFTLIELLAVIVILAIIALIATPIILDVIIDTKEQAYDRSVDNILDGSKLYYSKEQLKKEFDMDVEIYDEIMKQVDGEKPSQGKIYTNKNGEIAIALKYGEWCYTKAYQDKMYKKEKTDECVVPFYYLGYEETRPTAEDDFLNTGIKRSDIISITTKNSIEGSEFAEGKFDVTDTTKTSEINKVMLWYNLDENGKYEVYIGQEGGVKANPNSASLFENLINVKNIDLTYFDTGSVNTMYGLFANCYELESINVSKFDTSKVTNMVGMFAGTFNSIMKLEKIIGLENFDTHQVTTMYCMFQNCSSLTTLDLRSFDTSNVTNMSYMFYRTTNLKPIYIGEKWKTASTTDSMFGGTALTKSADEMCGPSSTHSYCTVTR